MRAAAGLLLWLGVALAGAAQTLQPVPPLTDRVVDLTGTLAAPQKQALEAELEALERRKGAQLAILMVATTQPEAIEQYGIRVVEAWKLGRREVDGKRVDDGVLLLVARDDRKVRIEVGYGLEG
ncbi:MAG TPA: TPM domain-containing protein, partial [Burkholderiaceae bacterium]|nr:TPM domain-containing protein [Burkholderiaceae bacterium]